MGKRVMVVDDSRVLKMQITKLLEGTDYELAAYCRSGEEAIERYEAVNPDFVSMDIIMPGMDGLEAARVILEAHPEARVIMVSSLAYGDTYDEAKSIGTKGFISKPFQKKEVLAAFEKAFSDTL